jgi:hypothetical protein
MKYINDGRYYYILLTFKRSMTRFLYYSDTNIVYQHLLCIAHAYFILFYFAVLVCSSACLFLVQIYLFVINLLDYF